MVKTMKDYDLYAIGAALVDTEVEVTDNFLNEQAIDKGLMTLVDNFYQKKLINGLKENGAKFLRKSGGSACNSVVAAAQLGSKTYFGGKIANDEDGDLFASDLTNSGVSHSFTPIDGEVTGKCLVMVTPDAERTMNTFLGVSNKFSKNEINYQIISRSKWFYVEGYLLTDNNRTDIIQEAVKYAKNEGVNVAISLSDPFVAEQFSGNLKKIIGDGVDLIFCNKDEAMSFTASDTIDLAAKKLERYSEKFVITDGANGATVFDGFDLSKVSGVKVCPVDTNGAGDMFAGVFLHAISRGENFFNAATLANKAASMVVQCFGPRLDDSDFFLLNGN